MISIKNAIATVNKESVTDQVCFHFVLFYEYNRSSVSLKLT